MYKAEHPRLSELKYFREKFHPLFKKTYQINYAKPKSSLDESVKKAELPVDEFLTRFRRKESLSSDILFSQLVCCILFHVILSHGHPRGDLNWNGDYACPLITGFETVTAKTGTAKFVLLYFFSPLKKYSKDAGFYTSRNPSQSKNGSFIPRVFPWLFLVSVEQNFAEINLSQHHFNMIQIKKMLDYEGSRCAQVSVVP